MDNSDKSACLVQGLSQMEKSSAKGTRDAKPTIQGKLSLQNDLWACGHTIFLLLSLLSFFYKSPLVYRLALCSAAFSLFLSLINTLNYGLPSLVYRVLLNENAPYLGLVLGLLITPTRLSIVFVALGIYSLYHVCDYMQRNPRISRSPYYLALVAPKVRRVNELKGVATRLASQVELIVLPWIIVGLFTSTRLLDLFFYGQFLRWQHAVSPRTKAAVEEWRAFGTSAWAWGQQQLRARGL